MDYTDNSTSICHIVLISLIQNLPSFFASPFTLENYACLKLIGFFQILKVSILFKIFPGRLLLQFNAKFLNLMLVLAIWLFKFTNIF